MEKIYMQQMENLIIKQSYNMCCSWKSITYAGVYGTCEFSITQLDVEDQFKIQCVFTYAADSKFRPRVIKKIDMLGYRKNNRVFASSDLGLAYDNMHLNITLSFDDLVVTGYYSTMNPIDCGALKTAGTKEQWKEVFGL